MAMALEIGPVELPLSGQHWFNQNGFGFGPYSDPADTTRKVVLSMICSGQSGGVVQDLQIVAMTSIDSGAIWSVVYGPTVAGYTGQTVPLQPIHGYQLASKIYIPNFYVLDFLGLYSFDLASFTFSVVNTALFAISPVFNAWNILGINEDGLCVMGSGQSSTVGAAVLVDVFTGLLIDSNSSITDPDNPAPSLSDWPVIFGLYACGVSAGTQNIVSSLFQFPSDFFGRIRTFTWPRGTISATPVFGLADSVPDPNLFNNSAPDNIFGASNQSESNQFMLDPATNKMLEVASWTNVGVDTWTTTVTPSINGSGSDQTRTVDGYFWSCTFGSTGTTEYMILIGATGIIAAVFSYDHSADPVAFLFYNAAGGTQRVVNGRLEVATSYTNFIDYPPDMNTAGGARMWYWRTTPLQLVYRSGCRYYATS